MKVNYPLLTALCLCASVPLAWGLLGEAPLPVVRVATFNAAMNRDRAGALLAELRAGSEQARKIAAVIQRSQVDVLLLCELDRDDAAATAEVFATDYLAVPQDRAAAIDFAFRWVPAVNTGEPSGLDLDRDGAVGGAGDAFGYGAFAGQYGMAVLSRHPIDTAAIRTFAMLPWSAMPDALRPPGQYDDATWARLRLSSKTHCDVPIVALGTRLHLLCSHPTPPVFDGEEDRNGRRNHDEIRFWVDYLTPGQDGWIVDDAGRRGGLAEGEHFAVLGDLNCDPVDGDARPDALRRLLAHPRVQDPQPRSVGGAAAALQQWGANSVQRGDPAFDTGDFDDAPGKGPGNLRLDYVLPSRSLLVTRSGVFWPPAADPAAALAAASDHRLVFVDVGLRAQPAK